MYKNIQFDKNTFFRVNGYAITSFLFSFPLYFLRGHAVISGLEANIYPNKSDWIFRRKFTNETLKWTKLAL